MSDTSVKILVVDDERDVEMLIRQKFRKQIKENKYSFLFACDGLQALETIRRDPQIILVSWCAKPVDVTSIAMRPGWAKVSAVAAGRIHEVDGADILSPGPSLLAGLRQIHEIIQQALGA